MLFQNRFQIIQLNPGFLFTAKSLKHIDVSIVIPLFAISPAITAIFAYAILKETITLNQIIGITLIVIGSYIITYKKQGNPIKGIIQFFKQKYYGYILLAIIFYALSSIGDRYILTTNNIEPITYVAIMQIFIAIYFVSMITIFHNGTKDIKEGFKRAKWLILIISVLTVGYRFAQAQAMKHAQAGLVIAIKRMSALLVVIMGGELFHEKHLLKKSTATIIMIIGVILIVI